MKREGEIQQRGRQRGRGGGGEIIACWRAAILSSAMNTKDWSRLPLFLLRLQLPK